MLWHVSLFLYYTCLNTVICEYMKIPQIFIEQILLSRNSIRNNEDQTSKLLNIICPAKHLQSKWIPKLCTHVLTCIHIRI